MTRVGHEMVMLATCGLPVTFRFGAETDCVASSSGRDAETIFIVRALLVAAVGGVVPCLLIAAVAKLVAPGYDAGKLSLDVGWPLGFFASLLAAQLLRGRS